MNVAQISFFVDREARPPEKLLDDWYALSDVAKAAAAARAKVTVIQAHPESAMLEQDRVRYFFIPPDEERNLLTDSRQMRALISEIAADVFHIHGLSFGREVLGLNAAAPQTPILLQDHADRPPRFWQRRHWRLGAGVAAGISFCALAQAQEFLRAGLIDKTTRLFEINESTSSFKLGDQKSARAATGMFGNPAILWIGHLNRNKDPLTVLDGFGEAVGALPDAHLWLCYGDAPLGSSVRARIARDSALRDRVHLLGRVEHAAVERLMQAADLFVLGSHREGCSFSLIEALATGLTPVVTDIPSMLTLTNGGKIGAHWQAGNAHACADALIDTARRLSSRSRSSVRSHFEAHLSSVALGRKLMQAYSELVAQ